MFCWLGLVAFRLSEFYRGLEDVLPVATTFGLRYGPIAFPAFGVVIAAGVILASVFSQRDWIQMVVIIAGVVLIICIARSLFVSYFGPAHPIHSSEPSLRH